MTTQEILRAAQGAKLPLALADADTKNAYDIEGYLKARLKLKPYQVCDVYEIDAAADD